MKYAQYIVKKRMKEKGISGQVNIPWGTILPVIDGFIYHNGQCLCAVRSENAKRYFWGYDPENPEAEIERQKAVAALQETAPAESGDELADPANPWTNYGTLEQVPGAFMWVWSKEVEDLPKSAAEYLLDCIKRKCRPQGVPM